MKLFNMSSSQIALLVLAIFSCLQVGLQATEERIVGGELVPDSTKYPSQCSLRSFGNHECGCTIVSLNHVLTTASCVSVNWALIKCVLLCRLLESRLDVHVGSTHINTGGQIYEVRNDMLLHPDYIKDDPASPDLAIVTLSFPFVLTSSVQIASLPAQDDPTAPGSPAVIVGWGYTADVGPLSPNLKEANVITRNLAECAAIYANVTTLTDTKVCADVPEGGVGYCKMDEGGPLYVAGQLHGVIQGHRLNPGSCAEPGYPDVFTRVASYANWIAENTF